MANCWVPQRHDHLILVNKNMDEKEYLEKGVGGGEEKKKSFFDVGSIYVELRLKTGNQCGFGGLLGALRFHS
jgi:hypothetical protein